MTIPMGVLLLIAVVYAAKHKGGNAPPIASPQPRPRSGRPREFASATWDYRSLTCNPKCGSVGVMATCNSKLTPVRTSSLKLEW
jgi:hypothetical protein